MRINMRMSFDCTHFACFSFFFAFTLKKVPDVIGLNRLMKAYFSTNRLEQGLPDISEPHNKFLKKTKKTIDCGAIWLL